MVDGEGLPELYAAAYRRLVVQLTALTGDLTEAEDVVQEAFARALPRWRRLAAYDDPEAWVRTVAVNLARNRWRSRRRGAAALLRLAPPDPAPEPSPDQVLVLQLLRTLPFDQRVVLVLHHLADQPVAAIADRLGVPEGTVKARLSRARRALAERQVTEVTDV